MSLPPSVAESVQELLASRPGRSGTITGARSVGGGCINPSARLETDTGDAYFLKWNGSVPVDMFVAEADGLQALADAAGTGSPGDEGLVRIPSVLGWGGAGVREDPGWLLMEFIPHGRLDQGYGARLGRGLAILHQATEGGYGWHRDNFIGSLPQSNGILSNWAGFWRDRRLAPQLDRARASGLLEGEPGRIMSAVLARMEELLDEGATTGPGLLHGDLWSGNFYPGPYGEPVFIDPAVYRGEGEVDLAMMELFGGFPAGFLDAYEEIRPLQPAYRAFRRDLYQLYYLLVHVNLFGSGYVSPTLAAARRVLAGP